MSQAHHEAVNRRRRIVVQYDPNLEIGLDLTQRSGTEASNDAIGSTVRMVGHSELTGQSVFVYEDDPETQIDAIIWDMGGPTGMATYRSKVLDPFPHASLRRWWDEGLDLVAALVDACRERELEVFWNHRISEADFLPDSGGSDPEDEINPVKIAHPDWVIRDIHWYGDWNYAVPEVRALNLEVLEELAANYDFDGFQIDFSRHVPCLPPGEEWAHRDAMTDFVRSVRHMTLDVERERGRPFLLGVKVPRNEAGCRADGFDVETWARQSLVDSFTVGCRSIDVDLDFFRRITDGRDIKLQPTLETHHATAGYKFSSVEFLRGVFGNFWQQGADTVQTFNWSAALQQERGEFPHRFDATRVELQALKEIGSPEMLAGRDKMFAIERRGGFPWSGGFFARNDTAPLPVTLANHGRPEELEVRICDNLRALADKLDEVMLRVVLHGAREGDHFEIRLNGAALGPSLDDHEWKDPQILTPGPQTATCSLIQREIDPDQKLLRMDYAVPPRLCRVGANRVTVRIVKRVPHESREHIAVEKIEIHVRYAGLRK
ncbi:MAG: hypothetical protein CMJ18_17570 [Phycisphaeraceae bacterium]|nr:hypothetical protein [Phycisphaeraceae bacterium]